jgi:hypothetical protein
MQPAIKTKALLDVRLGEALVEKGVITQGELDTALEMQKHREKDYLGEILLFMGVSQEKINKTLDYLNKRKKIGDILAGLELITPEDLEEALKEQKSLHSKLGIRVPLGVLLHRMGFIYYREYMRALSKHFVLPIVSLEGYRIQPSLQDMLGKRFIFEHLVLVLKSDGQKIKIALGEPTPSLMQKIRKLLPPEQEIVFYLAHPLEIESVHNLLLSKQI